MRTWPDFVNRELLEPESRPISFPQPRGTLKAGGAVALDPRTAGRLRLAKPALQRELGTDDASLMVRYAHGDARAFEILYDRHQGALYRYLLRLSHHPETANDLFQEVWSKVVACRERYEVRAQFKTFLFRIAHNTAMDHFRRDTRTHMKQTVDIEGEPGETLAASADERPEAQCARQQMSERLREALADLPEEQRNAFLLYEEAGLTLDEIGRITGVPLETAKSRLRYAVAKLKKALAGHSGE
jgi:RNA polymerase sigma-70 factor (ECF subfamily)